MQGQMQSYPLTLVHLFERAERLFGDKTITTATAGGIERTSYAEWAERTRRLGAVLGAGPAHAQHPALPRAAPVRRRPRAGRGHLRRPLAAQAAVAARRRAL